MILGSYPLHIILWKTTPSNQKYQDVNYVLKGVCDLCSHEMKISVNNHITIIMSF